MNEQQPTAFDGEVQAYVDGELDDAERAAFERRLRNDPRLAGEVARLGELKRSLRDAYGAFSAIRSVPGRPRRTRLRVAAALLAGVALGYFATGVVQPPRVVDDVARVAVHGDMTRVLLHVGTNDPDAMREALVSARYILSDFADAGRRVRVHVVANGRGLDMFRRPVSTFADEIRELERTWSNIQFVTCQNTIDRFEREHERPVELLPEVLRVDSIVADIARKRVQGWLYIGV